MPCERLDESLFTVTVGHGQPVAHLGATAKRPPATDSDYLQLEPGASVSNVVDLGDLYDFSGTGRYAIADNVVAYDLFDKRVLSQGGRTVLASQHDLSLKAAGRAEGRGKPPPPPQPPGYVRDSLQRTVGRTTAWR